MMQLGTLIERKVLDNTLDIVFGPSVAILLGSAGLPSGRTFANCKPPDWGS